jgi:hypothetical protein
MILRPVAHTLLFPARLAWATANRMGLFNFSVGQSPHLDELALARWREAIGRSKIYLEYGSGGSTIEAARTVDQIVSVETDNHFLGAVERAFENLSKPSARLQPIYVDIGWTEKWGRPLIGLRTAGRVDRWRHYPVAPWTFFEQSQIFPDFIFVDGRFRTACVLESLLRLPPDSDCRIMLDDFEGRKKRYGAVLEFADDLEFAGRAIIFRRKRDFNRDRCAMLRDRFQRDPE